MGVCATWTFMELLREKQQSSRKSNHTFLMGDLMRSYYGWEVFSVQTLEFEVGKRNLFDFRLNVNLSKKFSYCVNK